MSALPRPRTPTPRTCQYLPRACSAPATRVLYYVLDRDVRVTVTCALHERYVENAVHVIERGDVP